MDDVGRIQAELGARLREAGLDLLAPLQVGWYNDVVEGDLRLEDWGAPTSLGIVVGNSRALWPRFLDAFALDPALASARHPLDMYVENHVRAAVTAAGVPARIRFAHAPPVIAIQRLAHEAGLAYLTETHLSVHPTYGPWIALRAAVSFDARAEGLVRPVLQHPCGGCERHCMPAFERAVAATTDAFDSSAVRDNYRLWLAYREACPAGRAHRYEDAQIRYHYLHDPSALLSAVMPDPNHWSRS